MQQRPPNRPSPAATPGPSLQNSNQGVSGLQTNFMAPLPPPLPSFPTNGITPPHPHPVAPFPPPPHSHGTLHLGPIAPPPPSSPHRSQPFYTLAMTHLPTMNPRPRPHSSLFPHSPPQFPLPPPPPPPTTILESRQAVLPILPRPQLLQPVPLRFPYPTTINITCTHCGNHLIVDLTAHHLTSFRGPPSRPQFVHTAQNGPVFWRLPLVRPLTSMTPPTQTSVSVSSSAPLLNAHGAHLASHSRPPPPPRETPRETEKEPRYRKSSTKSSSGSSSKSKRSVGGREVSSRLTAGIIPYRERRRATSIETHARQQLELEFATLEKPTVMKMGEIAGRLSVSREFVRQWFASRHHRLQQRASSSSSSGETRERTIPSDTYEITVEVPPTDSYLLPPQTVVVQNDTSPK
ncbi:hypothetical protein GBAR_LOCUS12761 [Geodia barretti]|uniref:Homeobox domain-containing protein n=1 Tax=Geodia barretti TaxID=519541 RepID=A0AA35WHG6_GEOBA|nr:hypothetical protein GBAR_LOCUS12761 [Geodia barretti]